MNINEENIKHQYYKDNFNLDSFDSADKKIPMKDIFNINNLSHNDKFLYFNTAAVKSQNELSTKISLETHFTQTLLKDYLTNFKKSLKSIRETLSIQENSNCSTFTCIANKSSNTSKYNFKLNVKSYRILKDANQIQVNNSKFETQK